MKRGFVMATIILCALVAVKSVRMGIAASALAQYKSFAVSSPEPGGALEAMERADLLDRAVRYGPGDASSWYERGRFAHRLLSVDNDDILSSVVKKWGDLPSPASRKDLEIRLLEEAIRSYDEAARRNRVDAGSRYWRVFADEALARRLGNNDDATRISTWFEDLDSAMSLDPQRPERLLDIGRLAMSYGRVDSALDFLRRSLDLSHDGLEVAVETAWYSPAGMEGAISIVPERANTEQRFSRWLFVHWIFPESQVAWHRYRQLANLPEVENSDVLANGGFTDDLGTHFHDWEIIEVEGVKVTRELSGDAGTLRIAFSRGPANYFHVFQDVPITEGGRYRLEATVAAQGFTPSTRLGIEVVHPLSPDLFSAGDVCYVSAPPDDHAAKTASGGPVRLTFDFTVPDDLPVVRIRLRRHGGAGETDSGKGVMIWSDIQLLPVAEPASASILTGDKADDASVDHHQNEK